MISMQFEGLAPGTKSLVAIKLREVPVLKDQIEFRRDEVAVEMTRMDHNAAGFKEDYGKKRFELEFLNDLLSLFELDNGIPAGTEV